jgi:transposase
LAASAAMRSTVRRDTGESYEEFLTGLAKASGIATPTREDLARLDRKRKKHTSNKEWKSPTDRDPRVAKMKGSGANGPAASVKVTSGELRINGERTE